MKDELPNFRQPNNYCELLQVTDWLSEVKPNTNWEESHVVDNINSVETERQDTNNMVIYDVGHVLHTLIDNSVPPN